MKSDRFYLACLRDNVGSNVAFHGNGYHTDIDKARVYNREQAQKAWNGAREYDLPLCADRVDALTVLRVDGQYLPCESSETAGCTQYVAYRQQRWDGNDVYWCQENGRPTTDFALAMVYEQPTEEEGLIWVPFHVADAVKRRTFPIACLDRRKMIQAAGLLTPEHIKRQRRRKDSGKTRWNCTKCGKISWQYNPYDYEGCRDMMCDEWKLA